MIESVTLTYMQVTRVLDAGWNLLALPLQPINPLFAQDLLANLNGQSAPGNCSEVYRWDPRAGRATTRTSRRHDFSISPSQGYFVDCNAPSPWQVPGSRNGEQRAVSASAWLELTGCAILDVHVSSPIAATGDCRTGWKLQ